MTFNNNIHIAIVSWGRGCALKGYPGVYAQTDAFLDFISENSGPFEKSKDSKVWWFPIANVALCFSFLENKCEILIILHKKTSPLFFELD